MNTETNSKFNAALVTAEDKQILQDLRNKFDVTEKQLMTLLIVTALNNESELSARVADMKHNINARKNAELEQAKQLKEQLKEQRKQVRLEAKQAKDKAKAEAAEARKLAREQAKQAKAQEPKATKSKAKGKE